MLAYIIRRLVSSIFLLFVMSLLVFLGVYAIGNPVDLLISPEADQKEIARTIAALGLDKPLWEQYFIFVKRALSGDLGRSFAFNTPAIELILQRMPATMELAITAMLMAILLGIPLGLYAGLKPDTVLAKTIMAGSILGFSLPTFWVGLMLIMVFSVMLGWLPSNGRGATVDLLGVPVSFLTVDGLRHLLKSRPIYACEVDGVRHDTGNKLGFLKASVYFALKRPDIADAFRDVVAHRFDPGPRLQRAAVAAAEPRQPWPGRAPLGQCRQVRLRGRGIVRMDARRHRLSAQRPCIVAERPRQRGIDLDPASLQVHDRHAVGERIHCQAIALVPGDHGIGREHGRYCWRHRREVCPGRPCRGVHDR